MAGWPPLLPAGWTMPEVIETTVYYLEELSESAKDTACEWYRTRAFDFGLETGGPGGALVLIAVERVANVPGKFFRVNLADFSAFIGLWMQALRSAFIPMPNRSDVSSKLNPSCSRVERTWRREGNRTDHGAQYHECAVWLRAAPPSQAQPVAAVSEGLSADLFY